MESTSATSTPRTKIKRLPERGSYENRTIEAILDEGLICHVGFVHDGQPFVIPTIHARVGDTLYLHGSPASRMLRSIRDQPICVTVTLLDGLVLARSHFHSSMNYRSVVALGTGREVTDPAEKMTAFEAVVEHVARGQWDSARRPTNKELKATSIIAMELSEASAKIRTGDPEDDEEDYELDIWAGVIPISTAFGPPIDDERLNQSVSVPPHLLDYER
ncbi:MAG: pyridoxamine 5'-phosphate oxidase family protein [Acidimicrobiia bacterium]|nr:pyridoxamine 5'-phosphate oxidase family protein [Acidimicrobiia bacterium]